MQDESLTSGVDPREHSRGEHRALRLLLLPALELAHLVRVPQRTLDHGYVQLANDPLGREARRRAVARLQLELPHGEEVEDVVVELGHAVQVGPLDAAGLEVRAPLVRELVQQVAGSFGIRSFLRARVKALDKR